MAGITDINYASAPSLTVLIDPTTGLPYAAGGGGGGAVTIADGADVAEGARADAAYTSGSGSVIAILKGLFLGFVFRQRAISYATVALTANTAATALATSTDVTTARILNYTASPVYVVSGTSGTPASGAPSDYIPAAASGVPGQWEATYRPVDGLRVVGASAGNIAVITA